MSVRSVRGYGLLCGRKNAPAVLAGSLPASRRSVCILTLSRGNVKSEASYQCASLYCFSNIAMQGQAMIGEAAFASL